MAVKIRLSRKGRSKAPFYHIVVADARSPRDGKFIEKIGTYNPMTKPATIEIDRNSAYDWLEKGAQPTDTVKAILRFKGVYYKKHLMRGVKKGAMTVEQADTLWQQWIDAKEGKVGARRAQTIAELEAFRKLVSGEAKKAKPPVADESTQEASEAFKVKDEVIETAEPTVEEVVVAAEEPASEVVVAAEELAAEAVEEVAVAAEEPAAEAVEEVAVATEEEPAAEVVEEVVATEEEPVSEVVEEVVATEEEPVSEVVEEPTVADAEEVTPETTAEETKTDEEA